MTQKTLTYVVLIMLLGAGFLLGSFFGGFVRTFAVSAGHKQVVDNTKIVFTVTGRQPISTIPECVYSKTVSWGIQTTPLGVFISGKEYQYSIWLWKSQGEAQYVMQIWGPDETGKGYDIQLMRNYNPPFTVTYKGETIINKGQISATQEGNVWVFSEALYAFSVTVE